MENLLAKEPFPEDFPITRGSTDLALKFRSGPTLNREIQKPVEILPVVTENRELQPERVENKRPQLDRSDSIITVAHLYEDLIVSNRFRIRVTLTNFTVVVLLAAIMLPNFAAILYGLFRYLSTLCVLESFTNQSNTPTIMISSCCDFRNSMLFLCVCFFFFLPNTITIQRKNSYFLLFIFRLDLQASVLTF